MLFAAGDPPDDTGVLLRICVAPEHAVSAGEDRRSGHVRVAGIGEDQRSRRVH